MLNDFKHVIATVFKDYIELKIKFAIMISADKCSLKSYWFQELNKMK